MNPDFLRALCAAFVSLRRRGWRCPGLTTASFVAWLLAVAAAGLALPAWGIDRNWTGATSQFWSDPSNWSPAGTPQNGDRLFFGQVSDANRSMINDIPNLSFSYLSFVDNDYQLDGNALTIGPGQASIICGVNNSGSSHTTTFNCPIVFPNGSGPTVVYCAEATGLLSENTADIRFNGPVTINGKVAFLPISDGLFGGANGHVYISGPVTGSGEILAIATKSGNAVSPVIFNGTTANPFSGRLYLESDANGPIVFNNSSGTVVNNMVAVDPAYTTVAFYQADASGLLGNAPGSLIANLQLNGPGQIDPNATININAGGQLVLSGTASAVGNLVLSNYSSDANASILDTGSTTLGLNNGITSWNDNQSVIPTVRGHINLNGVLPFNVGGSVYAGLDILATVGSSGGISKNGTAALLLEANNTFSSDTFVLQGNVDVRNNGALGASANNTWLAGGTLTLRNASIGGHTLNAEGLSIAGDMPGSLLTCVGASSWSGPVQLFTNLVVVGDITLSGPISGQGGIGFFGGGTALLGGSAGNLYTGTTLVRCPLLEFGKPSGINAYAGPLVVGGGAGGTCEARWLNSYQNVGATATLYGNGIINLNNFFEDFGPITFNGGEVDTGTGALNIYAPLTVNPAPTSAFINGALRLPLGDNGVFIVGKGAVDCDLVVNAVIFGSPGTYVVKQGAGTMCLATANTFNAPTLLEQGIIDINNSSGLGTWPGLVIFDGATLRLSGSGSVVGGFEGIGAGVGATHGAVEVVASGSWSMSGGILLDGPTTINVGASAALGLNGPISSSARGCSFIKTGTGVLSLGGASANTYSGDTIVSAGQCNLAKSPNVISVPGNLVIGSAPPGSLAAVAQLQASGNLGGSIVTVNSRGLFDLNGFDQRLAQLNLNDGGSVQTGAGTLAFSSGGQISVGSQRPLGSQVGSVIQGILGIAPNAILTFTVAPYGVVLPFNHAPELDVPALIPAPPNERPGFIPAGIVKEGAGRMRLSGFNLYKGSTQVNGGTLIPAGNNALGALYTATVYVNNSGTLALDGGVTLNQPLYLNSSSSPTLESLGGTNSWASPITLEQDTTISVVAANGDLQVSTGILGNGSLTKIGPGTLQFSALSGNSYTGLTTVAEGLLESESFLGGGIPGDAVIGQDSTSGFNAALWLMSGQQMSPTANVTVNSSGFLELHYSGFQAPTQQLRSVTGKGLLTIDSQAALTLSNNSSFTFAGWLTGAGPLTKAGAGQFLLTDRSGNSTYSGPATVAGGNLRVDALVPGMSVDVKTNGRLRGGGQVGSVVVEPAGQLMVDSAVPGLQGGTLGMTSLQLSNSASLQLNFFGPSRTGGNEEIIATDPVLVSNATFVASFRYPPREGDVITAIDKTTGGPALGTFAGWVPGQQTLVGTVPVAINYAGGDGNDVTLTVSNLALAFSSYRLAEGNGNQTVEPDECNLLYVSLVNRRTNVVMVTNALLRATTPNALVTIPQATYPVIARGAIAENSTPFQFRTDPSLPCGSGVSFELVLWTATEGQFAVDFSVVGGLDCTHPTGPCQSCAVVSGQFDSNSPVSLSPLYFVGAPSICDPPKACPGADPGTNLAPFPYIVHPFSNPSTNELCLSAQLQFNCPAEPTNDLGVAAYLGGFDPTQPCSGYLGDLGLGGPPYPPFSFRVPAGSNFVLVVMARTTNLVCNTYSLELFGLPCPLPTLAISPEATPNTVRVHWSTAYPGWLAQQEGGLRGTFSNVAQLPAIVGGQYSLTNITAVTNQFYRLKQ